MTDLEKAYKLLNDALSLLKTEKDNRYSVELEDAIGYIDDNILPCLRIHNGGEFQEQSANHWLSSPHVAAWCAARRKEREQEEQNKSAS